MEHTEFVAEGTLEVGPSVQYFIFLDGEYLGKRMMDHFRLPAERGYTKLGRVRITVELLEEDQT